MGSGGNPFSSLWKGFKSVASGVAGVFDSALGLNIFSSGLDIWGGVRADDRAEAQLGLEQQKLALDRQQFYMDTLSPLYGVEQDITQLETQKSQLGVDVRETESQITSYQDWLDWYPNQRELQTKSFEYEGKQAYEGLMNALGYADAVAGATGRTAPGSSMALTAGKAKQDVVGYFGADMQQNLDGGLYGMQYG